MTLRLAGDASAAAWLTASVTDWWRFVVTGPRGYDAYARVRFIPDPAYSGQSENDGQVEDDHPGDTAQVKRAVTVLAAHTRTPADAFFAVWDGWPAPLSEVRQPRVVVPNREYVLLQGALTDFNQWEDRGSSPVGGFLYTPAFVWPADRAWCLTADVDPHFATVAGSAAAIADLLAVPDLDVVPDDPDVEPPFYF